MKFRLTPLHLAVGFFGTILIFLVIIYVFLPLEQEVYKFQDVEKAEVEAKCLQCHGEMAAFSSTNQHMPFTEGNCLDCHLPHPENRPELKLVAPVNELCFKCHYLKKELELTVQHSPFTQGDCISCHEPHGSNTKKILRAEKDKVCLTCHAISSDLQKKSLHLPFSQGSCTDCHKPHASQNEKLWQLPRNEMCFTCHFDRRWDPSYPVKHRPYQEGNCASCHSGHATDYKPLLPMAQKSFCLSCHTDLKKVQTYQHQPFEEGDCSGCHKPHVSKYADLAIAESIDLCYGCHSGTKADFKMPSIHPVRKNGPLECKNCHKPHTAPIPALLSKSGNSFCYQCHADVKTYYEESGHQKAIEQKYKQGNCLNCHLHHGSNFKPLLKSNPNKMCADCHDDKAEPVINSSGGKIYNHPLGEGYYDAYFEKSWVTCKSCHDIHSNNQDLLRMKKNSLCLTCHRNVEGWDMLWNETNPR